MNISENISGLLEYRPAAWLKVTGDDVLDFLQSQVTQDLRSQEAGTVSYALWLSQKGRLLADSLIFKVSDHEFWILSHGTSGSFFRERMESYIVADDVIVEDLSSAWHGVLACGEAAVRWVSDSTGAMLRSTKFHRSGGGFLFSGRRGIEPSVEWISEMKQHLPQWAEPMLGVEAVERARVLAGIPAVPADVGPGELPQEAGLEASAISFSKGCYLGQETMARLRSMGQIRRKLMRVVGEGQRPAEQPHALYQGAACIGELRTAVSLSAGGYVGFALIVLRGFDAVKGMSLEPNGPERLRVFR